MLKLTNIKKINLWMKNRGYYTIKYVLGIFSLYFILDKKEIYIAIFFALVLFPIAKHQLEKARKNFIYMNKTDVK